MFYLYRKAHKQGSIKNQAPTWGHSVRVAQGGTWAGCPLSACTWLHRAQPQQSTHRPPPQQRTALGTWVQEAAHAALLSPGGNL